MDSEHEKRGLSIIQDFITPPEEEELLAKLGRGKFSPSVERNRILRYGSKEPYDSNMISEVIPDYLQALSKKLLQQGLVAKLPKSVTVNEYFPTQSIAPHIDSQASGPVITILSLLSRSVMVFKRDTQVLKVELLPRSLVILKEEIRTKWRHSIEPVKDCRYSIVFRCSD